MVDALRHVRIVAAAAAFKHSLALAEDGTVFAWGGNHYGALGLQRIGGSVLLPQRIEALSGFKVCSVAAGNGASCAVAAAGELFTWGDDQAGLLGHGGTWDVLAPLRVEALSGEWVVAVSVGTSHTIAVTRRGDVFGWSAVTACGLPDNYDSSLDVHVAGRISSLCRYPQLSCERSPRGREHSEGVARWSETLIECDM